MSFQSLEFLFLFPIVCLIYYLIPEKARTAWLLLISFLFYLPFGLKPLLILILTALITYGSGLLIERSRSLTRKRTHLALALTFCLGLLFLFKYLNFAAEILSGILSRAGAGPVSFRVQLLLPAGLSFYLFTAAGYLIDVFRGRIPAERSLLRCSLFLSFFPKIIQGPIERGSGFLNDLKEAPSFSYDNIREGFYLMLFGFFQKLVIADRAAILVDTVYASWPEQGSAQLLTATLLFSMQIYCDFAGYTNIARGAARIMGFSLSENFRTPYLAVSVADFWRRWHISLTTWFRDYLYIPLGGNRKGRLRKYLNILIVFAFSGLWHGAAWHYVAWGLLNGALQVAGDLLMPVRNRICAVFRVDRSAFSHRLLKGICTFLMISLTWVFFRANSVPDALGILAKIVSDRNPWAFFDGSFFAPGLSSKVFHMLVAALLVQIVCDILSHLKAGLLSALLRQGIWLRLLISLALLCWIIVCGVYGEGFDLSSFIYTQY